jgi:2'-5' RNA ligase
MAEIAHSIWLSLDAAGEAWLSPVVDALAAEYGRPRFEPHITLLGELSGDPEATAAALRGVDWPKAPMAEVTGVDWGGTYFTAIFLEVGVPEEFNGIRDGLAQALLGRAPKPYRPHASLAYGPIEPQERSRLIARFAEEFAGAAFRIGSVAVVSSSDTTPIENWAVLWRQELD